MTKQQAIDALASYGIACADVVEHNGGLHFYANDAAGVSEWRCAAWLNQDDVSHWTLEDGWNEGRASFDDLGALLEALD